MQKNYKITSPTQIITKNKIWYKLTSKPSYLVLYKPHLYRDNNITESTLNILSMKSCTTLKTLKFTPSRDNIQFILHLSNTNTLILWSIEAVNLLSLSTWDLNTNLRNKFTNFNGSIPLSLELDPLKRNQFITCSQHLTHNWIQVKTWNSSTFGCIETLQFHTNDRIECARVNHLARKLIAISYEPFGHLKVWNLSSLSSKIKTIRFDIDLNGIRCQHSILVRNKFETNLFVTSHTKVETNLRHGREFKITLRMWSDYNEKIIWRESFDTSSPEKLFLFELNVNEFASMNRLSGTVKVWCWNRGVCLKRFNTSFQHISSCVFDETMQKLIFIRNRIIVFHLQSEHRYSQLAVFDMGLGKMVETLNEQIIDYGMQCWTVMTNLSIETCKFM